MHKAVLDHRFEVLEFIACVVVPGIFYFHCMDVLLLGKHGDRVGEPQLAALAHGRLCEDLKKPWRHDISAMCREIPWCFSGLWFLNNAIDLVDAVRYRRDIGDTVFSYRGFRHADRRNVWHTSLFPYIDHLFEPWRIGGNEFITTENGEWFVANRDPSIQDGCAVAIWTFLANVYEICEICDFCYLFSLFLFPSFFEISAKGEGEIEMILN